MTSYNFVPLLSWKNEHYRQQTEFQIKVSPFVNLIARVIKHYGSFFYKSVCRAIVGAIIAHSGPQFLVFVQFQLQ